MNYKNDDEMEYGAKENALKRLISMVYEMMSKDKPEEMGEPKEAMSGDMSEADNWEDKTADDAMQKMAADDSNMSMVDDDFEEDKKSFMKRGSKMPTKMKGSLIVVKSMAAPKNDRKKMMKY